MLDFLNSLVGNRTRLVAVASAIAYVVARFGFKVDPQALADFFGVAVPALMILMRQITKTPPGRQT